MALLRRLRSLMHRRRKSADLEDELRFHLETEADERRAAGASPEQANREARLDFGNPAVVAEKTRAMWGWTAWEQLGQDVRYAIRTLYRSRAFTVTALFSLALGIGANTLLYSLTDAVLLRSLPVSDPQSLVRMTWRTPKSENHGLSRHDSAIRSQNAGYTNGTFAYAALELFAQHDEIFSSVFAYQSSRTLSLNIHDQAVPATGEYVSGAYFRGLGITPAAGRWLVEEDDRTGAAPAVVVTTALADGVFRGPDAAVGQAIQINNARFTIVGVMPRDFFGTDPAVTPDVFVPLHAIDIFEPSRSAPPKDRFSDATEGWLEIMGRLRPGVSLDRAQATLAPPFQQFTEAVKASGPRWRQAPSLALVAGGQGVDGLRRGYSTPLILLLGLAGLILLLACSNIANLLLARSTARDREITLRLSLGAGRTRVIRQLMTESVVLSSAGGLLGVGLALVGEPFVTTLLANGRADFTLHADLNWRVLLFASGLSVATGLVFGVVPAIRSTRMRTASTVTSRVAPARALVVLQMGGTLVLLVTAGLLARTLANFAAVDLGFNPNRVLTVIVNAGQAGLEGATSAEIDRTLRARFATMPEVVSVGASGMALLGDGTASETVVPAGRTNTDESSSVLTVGAGFLRTMEVPIVQGRDLTEADQQPQARPVAVVSEAYARKYFGDQNPLGQILKMPNDGPATARLDFEIIGVARDVRYGRLLVERPPIVFFPLRDFGQVVYSVRTRSDSLSHEKAIRQIVRDANSRIPIIRIATQSTLIDRMIATPILLNRLCVTFALLALTIAVVGLYGSVAYDVSRRTREIGVRMALGARRAHVIRLVLSNVLGLTGAGVLLGVPAAVFATRFVEAYLFGVTPRDPITIGLAVSVLLAAACLASYAPARVAATMNPTVALRNE